MKNSQKIINEIGSADKPDLFPIITWIYKWRNRKGQLKRRTSEAFRQLTDFYYFEN